MKKNQLQKGFTLIELLVVIVIIGILATIGVATFQGYFSRARDTKRQTVVRNAAMMVKTDQVVNDTPDYRLGGTANDNDDSADEVEVALEAVLSAQGYAIPAAQQSVNYFYLIETANVGTTAADDFVVFACKESELGDTSGSAASDVAFLDGSANGVAAITDTIAETACAATPIAPVVTGYVVVNMD